jgi:hypothetical protein
MRQFFNVQSVEEGGSGWSEQSHSCLLGRCRYDVSASSIQNSVICNINTNSIRADGAIVMSCTARSIVAAPGSIVYNYSTADDLILEEGDVIVGVVNQDGSQLVIRSQLSIDGGIFI